MPWWLRRIERGGDVLAPGPPDLPLQYIDCRDLAAWLLHAADAGIGGAFNTVSKAGQAACAVSWKPRRLPPVRPQAWSGRPPDVIERAGIAPWTELPVWVPRDSELIGLHTGDVSAVTQPGCTAARSSKPCQTPGPGSRPRKIRHPSPAAQRTALIPNASETHSQPSPAKARAKPHKECPELHNLCAVTNENA